MELTICVPRPLSNAKPPTRWHSRPRCLELYRSNEEDCCVGAAALYLLSLLTRDHTLREPGLWQRFIAAEGRALASLLRWDCTGPTDKGAALRQTAPALGSSDVPTG